jgi:hypothetical protein
MHIGYWWESQKERDHWEDLDGRIILGGVIQDEMVWTGCMWLRIETSVGKFLSNRATGGSMELVNWLGMQFERDGRMIMKGELEKTREEHFVVRFKM